jgi:hypothetical protein
MTTEITNANAKTLDAKTPFAQTPTMSPTQFYELREDGKMVFRIDNHRLNTFGSCGQLFEYAHMRNYRSKRRGAALSIGGWWSRVMELFYREMSYGSLPSPDLMFKFAADAWIEEGMATADLKKFDQEQALLMVTDYFYKFGESDFRNWKIIGTETGFGMNNEVCIGEDANVVVYYVGKPDLIVYEYASDKVIICDHKTTDYIKSDSLIKYKPHPQTAGYVVVARYLAQHVGYPTSALTDRCIINIASRNPPAERPKDGVKKPRFIRATPNYSQAELDEWRQQILWKCADIKRAIVNNQWIRRENSCHLYGGCAFRGVCSVAPNARNIVLTADFTTSDPWVPYSTEEGDE